MTYKETLDYIYTKLPMFHRIGPAAYKPDLTNTIRLCELVGNPQQKFKSIHIAGTNGKGSVSHMLSAILQNNGYKAGLYTSPHYKDFRERIKVDGQMITEEFVVDFIERIKPAIEEIQPSFFEITVAMAFDYFAQQQVDYAVVETGLGGRLDSTNIINPILSVITNISYDHQNFLGDTLPLIAGEKAGIIKENIPVVIGETQEETKNVFIEKARSQNAPITFADQLYSVVPITDNFTSIPLHIDRLKDHEQYDITSCLTGPYQTKNIATVLQAVDVLLSQGLRLNHQKTSEAFSSIIEITGMLGRWMILGQSPLIIADGVHNIGGFENVLPRLTSIPHRKLHFVFGTVSDKDITPILSILPKEALYYFCKADIPRAKDATELQAEATKFSLQGNVYSSVKEAIEAAKKNAKPDDLVFIGGSIFIVGEAI